MEEATQTGAEPTDNPRNEGVNEIAAGFRAQRDADAKEGNAMVNPEPEEVAPPVETPAEKPAEEPVEDLETLVVDGQEVRVPKSKIYESGRRTLQKEAAADKRLEAATLALRQVEELRARLEPPAPKDAQLDEETLLEKIRYGDNSEAIAALRALQLKAAEEATTKALPKIVSHISAKSAAEWFETEYADIVADDELKQLAIFYDQQEAAKGVPPGRERFKVVGDRVRQRFGLNAKREAKQQTDVLPVASVRQKAPEPPKPKTVAEKIEEMRIARGGGLR